MEEKEKGNIGKTLKELENKCSEMDSLIGELKQNLKQSIDDLNAAQEENKKLQLQLNKCDRCKVPCIDIFLVFILIILLLLGIFYIDPPLRHQCEVNQQKTEQHASVKITNNFNLGLERGDK